MIWSVISAGPTCRGRRFSMPYCRIIRVLGNGGPPPKIPKCWALRARGVGPICRPPIWGRWDDVLPWFAGPRRPYRPWSPIPLGRPMALGFRGNGSASLHSEKIGLSEPQNSHNRPLPRCHLCVICFSITSGPTRPCQRPRVMLRHNLPLPRCRRVRCGVRPTS